MVLLSLVATLAGCSAARDPAPQVGDQPYNPCSNLTDLARVRSLVSSRQGAQANASDYVVGPGDLLTVTIYNYRPEGGDFTAEVRVDDQGVITLPMIDPVRAGGKSLSEVRRSVVGALRAAHILNEPLVGTFLKDYQGQQVAVLGAVNKPGLYPLSRGRQTLVDVLSMAGGLAQGAGNTGAGNYVLLRPAAEDAKSGDLNLEAYSIKKAAALDRSAHSEMIPVCFEGMDGETNSAFVAIGMRGGDLVVVPDAGQGFIDGEVDKPGAYPLTRGMTLTQLVASAGGFLYPADRTRVTLIRSLASGQSSSWEIDTEAIAARAEADILLQRNDRIVVPATMSKKIAYGVYETVTTIVRFSVGGAATIF